MKKMTAGQKERQKDEHRIKGKYAKVNPCECCGKSAGVDYYSHGLVDTFHGMGLVLCRKCAIATSEMTTLKDFKAYKKSLS